MLPVPSAGPTRSLSRVMRPLEQGRRALGPHELLIRTAFGALKEALDGCVTGLSSQHSIVVTLPTGRAAVAAK